MALKGDLASVDLAQVFQMLALNQKVGMLCIRSPRAWKALYFEPRGTSVYFNEHVVLDKVLHQITRTGRLAPENAQGVRDHVAEHAMSLGDALLEGGYLTDAELESLLRTEMEEEIYDLFFWNNAHFEFFEGATTVEGRDGQIDERFFFSTDTLIMEAARRIDEWSVIQERVSGALEIFMPLDDGSNILELDDASLALLDLVDGKRNVSRLIEITGFPPFIVYKGLSLLLDEGLIAHIRPDDLLPTAQECVQEGRFQDSINLYEKAIALGEGIPDSHEQVANVYEKAGEFELSVYHHKCVAEYHAGAGDIKRAVAILQHVAEVLPTDLAARERLVELTVGRNDLAAGGFDPVAYGKSLVDLYLEIGEIDRVRSILERLLRDNPYDVELKKSLINVHTKAGDTKRVVELYESIADDLVQERQPIEAVKYLQKILMLDRGRKDISERIRSLYVMDERRRSRRRSLAALAVILCVLTALAAAYYFYDRHARAQLVQVDAIVEDLLKANAYAEAAAEYEDFKKRFPLTMVSHAVNAKLSHIVGLKEKHDAAHAERVRGERINIEKHRASYRMAYEAYKSLFRKGRLDEALAKLEKIQLLVEQAGEAQDDAWARDIKLDAEVRALKDYLSKAFALDRQASEKFEAGEWREARRLWLDLIGDYEMSPIARSVRLPVLVRSRPPGATLYVRGQPVVEVSRTGTEQRKVTPCLLMCPHDRPQPLELRLDGFEPAEMQIESRGSELAASVLTAIPAGSMRFADPVRGRVSVNRTTLAAGLRGGRIALARLGTGRSAILQLDGLDELEGPVRLSGSAAVLMTKDGNLSAYSLNTGEKLWQERLGAVPLHEILLHNNRVIFADTRARLHAYDATDGGRIWSLALGGSPIGTPRIDGRLVRVSIRGGRILVIDLADGRVVETLRVPGGLATDPIHRGGAVVFGGGGKVFAYLEKGHRSVWEVDLGPSNSVEHVSVEDDSVIVVDGARMLHKIGLRNGQVESRFQLPGVVTSGPVRSGERLYFTLRERRRDDQESDLLLAVNLREFQADWVFRDGGKFSSGVVANDEYVFLPSSSGEVLRFR